MLLGLDVARVDGAGLDRRRDRRCPAPDFCRSCSIPSILAAALAIAFIASAETLLSAAAVDRMHDGVRTDYNKELRAQGVGNLLCGARRRAADDRRDRAQSPPTSRRAR